MDTILLTKLEAQLRLHCPELANRLRPPAARRQLDEVSRLVGQPLPDDVCAAYLWHDGAVAGGLSAPEWIGPPLFPSHGCWCSIESMLMFRQWDLVYFDSLDEPYWHSHEEFSWSELAIRPWKGAPPEWLHIGCTGTEQRLYIDLAPGPKGTVGQMISWDGGDGLVIAPSLGAYLQALTEGLESGRVRYHATGYWYFTDDGSRFHL